MSQPHLTCDYCGRRFRLQGMCRAHVLAELAIQRGDAKLAATGGNMSSSMQLTLGLIEKAAVANSSEAH